MEPLLPCQSSARLCLAFGAAELIVLLDLGLWDV